MSRGLLCWTGTLSPAELSREYLVRMDYERYCMPRVRVLRPTLEERLEQSLPHVYTGRLLCLHEEQDWNDTMLLAHTIVPWTSEWLFFYEIWKATGDWHGGGVWPPPRQTDSTLPVVPEPEGECP